MFEELRENPKKLVIVLGIGIGAILILFIFLLFIIWSPKKDLVEADELRKNIYSGKYIYTSFDEKKVVEEYCMNITQLFGEGNIDKINDVMLPQYMSNMNYDKVKLKYMLEQRGLLGVLLKFYDYKSVNNSRYGRIFEVEVGSYDGFSKDKLYIIESSPRNYYISFDGFLGEKNLNKELVREGIKLSIYNIKEMTNSVSIKVKIENNLNSKVVLNKNGLIENVYLKLSNGSETRLSTVWLAGTSLELKPNSIININLQFNPGYMQSGYATNIVFKDVYDEVSQQLKEIEFPL
jgi:hypothetical protein